MPKSLFYAATFHVFANHETGNLYETVMRFIYEHVSIWMDPVIRFENFVSHGVFASSDQTVRASIASITDQSVNPPLYSKWAISLRMADPVVKRRRWHIHIGVQCEESNQSILIGYAEQYEDHNARHFIPVPSPQIQTPAFVQKLLYEQSFDCVVGSYRMPTEAIEMTYDHINSYCDLVYAKDREIPIFIISCPDLADPEVITQATLGNAIVFYTKDPGVVIKANEYLPADHLIEFDSMHIFLPPQKDKLYHYVYTSEAVMKYGANVVASIRRAFCESIPSEYRSKYPTYNSIMQQRNLNRLSQCEEQIKSQDENISGLLEANKQLQIGIETMEKNLVASEALVDRNLLDEVTQYEAVIAEGMDERDTMNRQISTLASLLFQGKLDDQPSLNEMPATKEISYLCEAISFFRAVNQSSNNKTRT